jgi:transposase
MLESLVKRCAGIDVHKEIIVCTVLIETANSGIQKTVREYSSFKPDLANLAKWLKELDVELAVMESTGVYWKSVYEALENEIINTYVVNAHHIKKVPGRKTDVSDSEWLAELARCGLLRASFIPPRDLRELRMLTRYRRKLNGLLSGQKNRLHKVLDDAGIRLGCVVSDIDGVSAKNMIAALISGDKSPDEIAELARGKLRQKKDQLRPSLEGRLSDRHRFLLRAIEQHIEFLQQEIAQLDAQIVAAMQPYEKEWQLLQTIPGIDQISAAMLLAEIGTNMQQFGNQDRLCSWAGMCPGNNETAGKKKPTKTRQGNPHMKSILCEIAHSAVKTKSQFRGIYQSLAIRRGAKRAITAVGHKILEVIFILLKRQVPYKDPQVDYEALVVSRNAPRWLRSLQKFGYLQPT